MKRLLLSTATLLILLGSIALGARPAAAASLAPRVAHVALMPAIDSCNGDDGPDCDGYAPPPVSGCDNVQSQDSDTQVKDNHGLVIADFYYFYSLSWPITGCKSSWAGIKAYVKFTITAYANYEANGCDGGSRAGPYAHATPYTVPANTWYSTNMVAVCEYQGGAYYHAGITYTDENGVQHNTILNTPNYYPS